MCLEDQPEDSVVTEDMCYPSNNRIISDIKHVIDKTGIKKVFIGSDSKPPLTTIREALGDTVTIATDNYMNCMLLQWNLS